MTVNRKAKTHLACIVAAVLALMPVAVAAFDLRLSEPELVLRVPGVPAIEVSEPSAPKPGSARLLLGHDEVYTVELELQRQASEVSSRVCAGLLLRSIVAKPGMPNRDNIYRAPLNAETFLVIYALGDEGAQQLHAHILSSAGSTHCSDAHFHRPATPGEDIDAWRTTFTSARVGAAAK